MKKGGRKREHGGEREEAVVRGSEQREARAAMSRAGMSRAGMSRGRPVPRVHLGMGAWSERSTPPPPT